MLTTTDLLMYRNHVVRDLQEKQKQRSKEMLDLNAQIAALEAAEQASVDLLARADALSDRSVCPACFVFREKNIPLVAVGRPDDGVPGTDYFRCGDRCGFDNLP